MRWRWRRCASNEGDGDDAIFAMAEFAWATLRERGVHDLPRTEFAPHFERWLLLRYDLPKPSTGHTTAPPRCRAAEGRRA